MVASKGQSFSSSFSNYFTGIAFLFSSFISPEIKFYPKYSFIAFGSNLRVFYFHSFANTNSNLNRRPIATCYLGNQNIFLGFSDRTMYKLVMRGEGGQKEEFRKRMEVGPLIHQTVFTGQK